ncbi:magnesium transporter NIPA-domain-containing protein [Epithele typhae]|uniref:magnesium transporter NIPA-domain-containing protein n=1 Tax=Epithele typhae TaxID=378194 RepID=UPI002008BFFD|nr:magnesium transporter NIPA-domain-containing protein [Epithele typhae]KAH9932001.1 magnesium transporter NIPA-domain-containing protein [Epithele typhae]
MIDDKYIGIIISIAGSVGIGGSSILTKLGLIQAGNAVNGSATDQHAYFKNPLWWTGMVIMVLGEILNFVAYTFAPPILITPLGALSVIIGAVLASLVLKERLGHLGRVGCALCLLGSLIIVLHAPPDKDVGTVDEILHYALQPGFLTYSLFVLVFALVMIYAVVPKYGRSNPSVYISICSLVGSVSVMAIKGLGVAVKLTFEGNNQFTRPATYVFGVLVVTCIVVQTNYFNKALDAFHTNVVNPMYYVGFSTATIIASIILFQGINTDDPANSISLLAGLVTTFLGVHLLELARARAGPTDRARDRSRSRERRGGYARAREDEIGLETIYEPEPGAGGSGAGAGDVQIAGEEDDDYEDLADERTRLQRGSRSPDGDARRT